ncbi:hypothetical protein [Portibacter lacus]|uniref:Uncharacterized protein n=1 Tax=Portibacter lacus TaxID=1099794 RepID=A0AA37SQH6_9BACT|nr:hypothetical protein [Portibacter lacus]GLR17529.1 hypothetical protein GCM10007940_21440 [Portibacter lacus]
MKKVWILLILAIIVSCAPESKYDDYDLLKHGLSLKIKAPADPEVSVTDLGIAKDVTVKKGDHYNIQIISSTATTYNIADIIAEKKQEVEGGTYFSQIIQEDENGFIFEKKIDENNINYDFRAVKIVGDVEYDFQTGLMGKFTKEDVLEMYEAVK